VTTGEGGVCLTDDPKLAERLQDIRNLYFGKTDRFNHSDLGYNFRMTNLQAAIGVGQLRRINEIIARKIWIGETYTELMQTLQNRRLIDLPAQLPHRVNSYWMYGCVLTPAVEAGADTIRSELADRGIDTRAFFAPLHRQKPLQGRSIRGSKSFDVANRLGSGGFYLPSGIGLERDVIEHVVEQLEGVIDGL